MRGDPCWKACGTFAVNRASISPDSSIALRVAPCGASDTSTSSGYGCGMKPNGPVGCSRPPITQRLRSGRKPYSSARMPMIHTSGSWPYMPNSPIVLPTRSSGPVMPLSALTNTAECRNSRLAKAGMAM